MPGRWLSVPGTNTIGAMLQATIPPHVSGTMRLWKRKYPSGFYRNGSNDVRKNWWTWAQHGYAQTRWPSRSGYAQDPASPHILLVCCDLGTSNAWGYGPSNIYKRGTPSLKFIIGTCKDADGNTVSGAVVQGFLTETDALVRETTADSNGRYELGTEYASPRQHYLVAYRAGSPDIAGTTVNTLTATNRDGS